MVADEARWCVVFGGGLKNFSDADLYCRLGVAGEKNVSLFFVC